jgi:hypothetical protein
MICVSRVLTCTEYIPILLQLAALPSFTHPLPSSVWTLLHTVQRRLLSQHRTSSQWRYISDDSVSSSPEIDILYLTVNLTPSYLSYATDVLSVWMKLTWKQNKAGKCCRQATHQLTHWIVNCQYFVCRLSRMQKKHTVVHVCVSAHVIN